MLDNYWWNYVYRKKKGTLLDILCLTASRGAHPRRQCPSISLPLAFTSFLPSSRPFLLLPPSLPRCMFMHGRKEFHTTCVPTAVWVSGRVCLVFCTISLCQRQCGPHQSKADATVTADLSFNTLTSGKSHIDQCFQKPCMPLGKAHYCAISLDEVLIYILTSHVQDILPEPYYSSTFELFHFNAATSIHFSSLFRSLDHSPFLQEIGKKEKKRKEKIHKDNLEFSIVLYSVVWDGMSIADQ